MDYSPYEIPFSAEGRRRVYAFTYVLNYSRRQYSKRLVNHPFGEGRNARCWKGEGATT